MTHAPDLYGRYHKGLRLVLARLLTDLGACDPADREAWDAVAMRWRALEETLALHSHHEDSHIHPLVVRANPEIAAHLDAQHQALEITIAHLGRLFDAVPEADGAEAGRAAAHALYLRMSGFVADYFQHLLVEEQAAMPALAARFPAETLVATLKAMLATIPPERRMADLALMTPALRPDERAGLPGGA